MTRYIVILHDSGWNPEYHEFRSRSEAEEFLYNRMLEAVDIDELTEVSPTEAERLLTEGPKVIYDVDFCWGENDTPTVMFFEVTDGEAAVLIPIECTGRA